MGSRNLCFKIILTLKEFILSIIKFLKVPINIIGFK